MQSLSQWADSRTGGGIHENLSLESGASTPNTSTIVNDYRTMQDLVFSTLRDEILSGRLAPGERLNIGQIAERLGVSRTPVRESMNRLASVGLIEIIPHRGSFVKKLSLEEIIEIYYIRAALEGIAARLAARNLGSEAIERLRAICAEVRSCVEPADDDRFLALNFEFHDIIFRDARALHLEELIRQHYVRSEQYRALSLDLPGRHAEICAEHQAIAEALAARDADRAEHHAREHHLNTARRIARSIGSTDVI